MFCHQCGKELREASLFCSFCGAPAGEASSASETDSPAQLPPAAPEPDAQTPDAPSGLILNKGKVTVSDGELQLTGKHYARKSGKKKFKKKRTPSILPLASILSVSTERFRSGGRIFLSLLFLLCFLAGAFFSSRYGYDAYLEFNTPYRAEEMAALEELLELVNHSGVKKLSQYQDSLEQKRADVNALTAKLEELEEQQTQEILAALYTNDKFDLDTFFNNDFFSLAYQEYLQDLLDAFKEDEAMDSWLYSYYETAGEYGGNYFLDTDMWIYDGGENKFSPVLDSASSLMRGQYDLDFYEHMLYTGQIYVTASGFMREILSLPRYTVDGAVFVNAFGGVPEASEMNVPGWSRSHYEEFWLYGADYYSIDTPMWLDYGLSAEGFGLDWNGLLDEAAYYNAYRKFMDKIAPGLPCYDMAAYHAEDQAYGGMGYKLQGTEASVSDMVAAYAGSHPDFIENIKNSGIYDETAATSVDDEIADARSRLRQLESELLELEKKEEELEQLLADGDIYRYNHEILSADIERHTQEFTLLLGFLGGASLICGIAALFCLCRLFGFLRRPRCLFVIRQQDRELAFNAGRLSGEQLAALQSRLAQN